MAFFLAGGRGCLIWLVGFACLLALLFSALLMAVGLRAKEGTDAERRPELLRGGVLMLCGGQSDASVVLWWAIAGRRLVRCCLVCDARGVFHLSRTQTNAETLLTLFFVFALSRVISDGARSCSIFPGPQVSNVPHFSGYARERVPVFCPSIPGRFPQKHTQNHAPSRAWYRFYLIMYLPKYVMWIHFAQTENTLTHFELRIIVRQDRTHRF